MPYMKTCTFIDCGRKEVAKGHCTGHYQQMRSGRPLAPLKARGQIAHCSYDGCNRKHYGHGYCSAHWKQFYRGKTVQDVVDQKAPAFTRFMRMVEPNSNHLGCWQWSGGTTKGYPKFDTGYGHRFSYTSFTGPIPARYEVDHLCRNPLCVNPAHLEAVTHSENLRRKTLTDAEHFALAHRRTV